MSLLWIIGLSVFETLHNHYVIPINSMYMLGMGKIIVWELLEGIIGSKVLSIFIYNLNHNSKLMLLLIVWL